MDLHVFPILIPPPTSLSTRSLWVFPVRQPQALVSCIQPGLVICFTLDNIHVSMLFSWNIPPSPSPTESKTLFCTSVSLFLFCMWGYRYYLPKFHIYVLVYCNGLYPLSLLGTTLSNFLFEGCVQARMFCWIAPSFTLYVQLILILCFHLSFIISDLHVRDYRPPSLLLWISNPFLFHL